MLKLNDTALEAVSGGTLSGGYGTSFSFKKTLNLNIANIQVNKNKVIDSAIEVGVTQANGNIHL